MRVEKYFEGLKKYDTVTFIKARARKDANTPFYHAEYQTTPLNTVNCWMKDKSILDYIILNDRQTPIEWLSGASWAHERCLLIISAEDFALLYPSEEQRKSIETFIEKKIRRA